MRDTRNMLSHNKNEISQKERMQNFDSFYNIQKEFVSQLVNLFFPVIQYFERIIGEPSLKQFLLDSNISNLIPLGEISSGRRSLRLSKEDMVSFLIHYTNCFKLKKMSRVNRTHFVNILMDIDLNEIIEMHNYASTKPKNFVFSGNYDSQSLATLNNFKKLKDWRDKLFIQNVNLVNNYINENKSRFTRVRGAIDMADVISFGYKGLLKAIDKFNPRENNQFSTLAYIWINKEISRNLQNHGELVRRPVWLANNHIKVTKAIFDSNINNFDPDNKEHVNIVAERTGFKSDKIKDIYSSIHDYTSFDQPVNDGDEGPDRTLLETFHDEDSVNSNFDPDLDNKLFLEALRSSIEQLEFMDASIIKIYFNLDNSKDVVKKYCQKFSSKIKKDITKSRKNLENTNIPKINEYEN